MNAITLPLPLARSISEINVSKPYSAAYSKERDSFQKSPQSILFGRNSYIKKLLPFLFLLPATIATAQQNSMLPLIECAKTAFGEAWARETPEGKLMFTFTTADAKGYYYTSFLENDTLMVRRYKETGANRLKLSGAYFDQLQFTLSNGNYNVVWNAGDEEKNTKPLGQLTPFILTPHALVKLFPTEEQSSKE